MGQSKNFSYDAFHILKYVAFPVAPNNKALYRESFLCATLASFYVGEFLTPSLLVFSRRPEAA
jgi:hypothetical protein